MKYFYLILFLYLSHYSAAQTKIGIVNSQKVLEALPYRDSIIKVIAQIEKEGIAELMKMDSLMQVRINTCTIGNKAYIDPLVRQSQENELRMLQSRIQYREKEIDSALTKISEDVNQRSLATTKKAIEMVSKSMGISLVLDSSTTLFFDDQIDITEQVIQQALKLE